MPPFELRFYRTGYRLYPVSIYLLQHRLFLHKFTNTTNNVNLDARVDKNIATAWNYHRLHTYVVRIYLKHAGRERALPFHRSTARALTQQRGRVGRVLRVLSNFFLDHPITHGSPGRAWVVKRA